MYLERFCGTPHLLQSGLDEKYNLVFWYVACEKIIKITQNVCVNIYAYYSFLCVGKLAIWVILFIKYNYFVIPIRKTRYIFFVFKSSIVT